MRTVQIHFGEEFLAAVDMPSKAVDLAVGYLSCWGIAGVRFASVVIYGERDGNISVTYRNAAGEVTFGMYALRSEDGKSYSFHS